MDPPLQQRAVLPVEVGAAADAVVAEVLLGLLGPVVLSGVRPQQVAHGPERRGLFEPVQLQDGRSNMNQTGMWGL